MNDAEVASVLSPAVSNNHPAEQRLADDKREKAFFLPPPTTSTPLNGAKVAADDNNDDARSVKADSEAETIIQSGREELSPEKKRLPQQQKLESNGGKRHHHEPAGTRCISMGDDFKARKRKRMENDPRDDEAGEARQSSRPNSRLPSPTLVLKKEKLEEPIFSSTTRAVSVPRSENGRVIGSIEHQKYVSGDGGDNVQNERRHGRQGRNALRETRHHSSHSRHLSHGRSTSPAVRSHKRVLSTSSQPTYHLQKRKRPPSPLLTGRRRHSSEDSLASSSRGSPLPTGRRVRHEYSATSPAKQIPPMKRQRDQNGRTRLARACAAQEVEVAKARYATHAEELDVPDNAGNTPLQIAALEGSADIVKFLLDSGCDINTKNIDKDTPLIDAVENGHLDVVKLLLDAGANPRVGNAQGDEPYDLIRVENENYEELRKVIEEAKERGPQRKLSDTSGSIPVSAPIKEASSRGASVASPRNSPPVPGSHAARTSPPIGLNRRKNVRREATRNDLLWTRQTLENLRDFAAKGDIAGVANILNVLQKADSESLIAAAKGGHDEVLGILLGMGNPDPNPEPIRAGNHKPGYDTPMLAAIGRGNNSVIKLLLEQKGFDPTRTDHRGRTYHQLSEDRKGEGWRDEFELLKNAYDNFIKSSKPGRPELKSPRKFRDSCKDFSRHSQKASVSPASSHRKPGRSPESRAQQGLQNSIKTKRDIRKNDSLDRASVTSHRRTHLRDDTSEYQTASDPDSIRSRMTKPKLLSDSKKYSETGSQSEEPVKRRRLIAGRPPDRRRGSFMSTDSNSARDDSSKERRPNLDPRRVKESSPSKRSRESLSPKTPSSRIRSKGGESNLDAQHKRRKIRAEKSPPSKESARRHFTDHPLHLNTQPKEPSLQSSRKTTPIDCLLHSKKLQGSEMAQVPSSATTADIVDDVGAKGVEQVNRSQRSDHTEEKHRSGEMARIGNALDAMTVRDVDETQGSDVGAADAAAATAAAVMAAAAAAAAARKRAEEEEEEKEEEEEEAERQRKDAEQRRIKQAEEERRLIEEEASRLAKIRREQEEKEQRRRDALPFRLRTAANLIASNDPKAKDHAWLSRFIPLFTVKRRAIDVSCDAAVGEEQWIVNYQVAPLLATNDLQLSQYPSWEKRIATLEQRYGLWRLTRGMLAYAEELCLLSSSLDDTSRRIEAIKPKFYLMEHIFWVKLSDFMDLVPHIPHLKDFHIHMRKMAFMDMPEEERVYVQSLQHRSGQASDANNVISPANTVNHIPTL
ncbi:hypothetical protein LOZ65_006246 [Ophidiomyces ophidiicola]|nr:hypothetical protein LOZ65_006246 [Ophidiomyces ophidiicola]